ncbi:Beta 1,3 (4)-glucanase [Aphelenchoides fujianensis]|nr:Beta 1,3 (4)-glucanase [Aphelenchoides fujianensis]
MFSQLFLVLLLAVPLRAAYRLVDDFTPRTLLDGFVFDAAADETHGFVNYLTKRQAAARNLTRLVGGRLFVGADAKNVVKAGSRGRDSVRMHSRRAYNHGLFLLDLQHMPGGQCGSWPAFWLYNINDWPQKGEIDVIEGVNSQTFNSMTLHTTPNCSIRAGGFSGHVVTRNCAVDAKGQPEDSGCSIETDDTRTYGAGFNRVNGGVYALQWTSTAIKIWFFPRARIPADIASGRLTPARWPQPLAAFRGCDFDAHIRDQFLTFDLTFCGDWAGSVWTDDAVCKKKAKTCKQFVRENPGAFRDAYWLINYLKVYQ